MEPSDDLLRTMAAVPVQSAVLDLGCGNGRHTEPLLRLGFPVHACDPRPDAVAATRRTVADLIDEETAEQCVDKATLDAFDYPEETFDWVVAFDAEVYADTGERLEQLFRRARQVLKPGGWVYITVPAAEADLEGEERSGGDGRPVEASDPGEAFTISELEVRRQAADLELAKEPEIVREGEAPRVHAIYRKVQARSGA